MSWFATYIDDNPETKEKYLYRMLVKLNHKIVWDSRDFYLYKNGLVEKVIQFVEFINLYGTKRFKLRIDDEENIQK